MQKHASRLVAKISLIRQETAETLGLKGKDVTVTIVKVCGQEETMRTKEYKVQLACIDKNKRFTDKAIRTLSICDEIPTVTQDSGAARDTLTC